MTNPEFEVTEEEFQASLEFHFLTDEELVLLLGRPDPVKWQLFAVTSFCVGFQVLCRSFVFVLFVLTLGFLIVLFLSCLYLTLYCFGYYRVCEGLPSPVW